MSTARDFDRLVVLEFMRDDPLTVYLQRELITSPYDPATGEAIQSTIEIPLQGLLLDLTLRSNGTGTAPGTLIQDGDKELYIRPPEKTDPLAAPLVMHPESDKIRIGSTIYSVVEMKEANNSASNPIVYLLYIRK